MKFIRFTMRYSSSVPLSLIRGRCVVGIPAAFNSFSFQLKLCPLDTGRKLNVHKTFRRRPASSERLMYVQFTSCIQGVLNIYLGYNLLFTINTDATAVIIQSKMLLTVLKNWYICVSSKELQKFFLNFSYFSNSPKVNSFRINFKKKIGLKIVSSAKRVQVQKV